MRAIAVVIGILISVLPARGGEEITRRIDLSWEGQRLVIEFRQLKTDTAALGLRNETGTGRVRMGKMDVFGAFAGAEDRPLPAVVTREIVVEANGRKLRVPGTRLAPYLNLHLGEAPHDWNAGSGRLIAVDRGEVAMVVPGGGGEKGYALIIVLGPGRAPRVFRAQDVP